MPIPVPERAQSLFPQSIAWRGESWENVVQYHLRAAQRGSETYRLTFDDDDRLCVTCHDEGGYSVRIPKPMIAWAESIMREAGVEPGPEKEGQARLTRGPEGSLITSNTLLRAQDVAPKICERTGYAVSSLTPKLPDLIVDFNGTDGLPFLYEALGDGCHALGFISRDANKWVLRSGTLLPAIGGCELNFSKKIGSASVFGFRDVLHMLSLDIAALKSDYERLKAYQARPDDDGPSI